MIKRSPNTEKLDELTTRLFELANNIDDQDITIELRDIIDQLEKVITLYVRQGSQVEDLLKVFNMKPF